MININKFNLNTPRKVTNGSGTVVFDWNNSDPFGGNAPTVNTIGFNVRYPGQYYDAESEYHYNYYRYYNPRTGKYLQADPIGLAGGLNVYNYTNNDSLNSYDENGLWAQYLVAPAFGGVVGGIVGGAMAGYSSYQNDGTLNQIIKSIGQGAGRGAIQGGLTGLSLLGVGRVVGGLAGLVKPGLGGGYATQFISNAIGNAAGDVGEKYWSGNCNINWHSVGVSAAIGGIGGSLFFKPYILPRQYVTSWAEAAHRPILDTGKWVMMGGKNPVNHFLSGTKYSHDKFPAYPFNHSITGVVPGSKLSYPDRWEYAKGLMGQRVIQ